MDIVHYGLTLSFATDNLPSKGPFRQNKDVAVIDAEINALLQKQVIESCEVLEGDYFSSLFVAPKKDGTYRTILNLKFLNTECRTSHFKMESLKQALHMIKRGVFLASVDIKDAFYSVPIHMEHRKYLKFMWKGQAYRFCAMPNGYLDAMRVFTKLLKPVFSSLRERGYESIIYVDDSLLQGNSEEECFENVSATLHALQELGFIIHPKKSTLIPTQRLEFLGFIIDTVQMTVTLTDRKKQKILKMGLGLLSSQSVSIHMVSSFVGNITAACEGVPYGKLHYRHIEVSKTISLKKSGFNFEGPCYLSRKALEEITWWTNNIEDAFAHIKAVPPVDYTIFTDASKKDGGGWGASNNIHEDINGRWSFEEQLLDINCLELMAIKLAILAYVPLCGDIKHVRIMSDNTSAISYINKMGGTHCMTQNDLAVEIWEFLAPLGVHISAAHIPGKHNILADKASREFVDAAEWMLPPEIFSGIIEKFGTPDIDLFASRLNKQLPVYVSWKPDPDSAYIDAMLLNWSGRFIYAFPPFSMLWPVISKLEEDQVERAIIVMPEWPTQSWFPRIMRKKISEPIRIPTRNLILPGTTKIHPLASKRSHMLAVLCSHIAM